MGHKSCDLFGEVGAELQTGLKIHPVNIFYSPNMLLSGSRDKTLIIWNLTREEQNYGYPKRSLHGHSHIVSDCVSPKPAKI